MSPAQSIQWLLDHLDDPELDDNVQDTECTSPESKVKTGSQDNAVAPKVTLFTDIF